VAPPSKLIGIDAALARLTDTSPRGMGAIFKAIGFSSPDLTTLPAFEPEPVAGGGA
jgi:hypothetical protein